MKPFTLHLQDISQYRRVDDVVSFIGTDASGDFGVLAQHGPLMTSLAWGLARYRSEDGRWHYLMLPGGLLHMTGGELYVATRRFFQDDNLERILGQYEAQLRTEEAELRALKQQIKQLEQAMLNHLWRSELGVRAS
jgi:F-type H+-transporting ATPase subunit epsilon